MNEPTELVDAPAPIAVRPRFACIGTAEKGLMFINPMHVICVSEDPDEDDVTRIHLAGGAIIVVNTDTVEVVAQLEFGS